MSKRYFLVFKDDGVAPVDLVGDAQLFECDNEDQLKAYCAQHGYSYAEMIMHQLVS